MTTELEKLNARNHLIESVREYVRVFFEEGDPAYVEKYVAGVMAFLHVNYWKEPYMPVDAYPVEEESKPWYQFWK